MYCLYRWVWTRAAHGSSYGPEWRGCSFEYHLSLFWTGAGGTQQGLVGLSVFFCLCVVSFQLQARGRSSRFDSGVSILVAAFVRPDGWIQRPCGPSGPAVQDLIPNEVLYSTVLYRGGQCIARAVRHGSLCELHSWFGHVTPVDEGWREWLGSLVYTTFVV